MWSRRFSNHNQLLPSALRLLILASSTVVCALGVTIAMGAAHDQTIPWPVDADTAHAVAGTSNSLPTRFPNIPILPTVGVDQTEISVAIDPGNELHIIVGANTLLPFDDSILSRPPRQGSYFSLDGGLSWFGSNDSPAQRRPLGRLFDPVVAIDGDGQEFRGHLEYVSDPTPGIYDNVIWKLSDDDSTWESPMPVPAETAGVVWS